VHTGEGQSAAAREIHGAQATCTLERATPFENEQRLLKKKNRVFFAESFASFAA
jgi:hypothetical protein